MQTIDQYTKSKCFSCGKKIDGCGVFVGEEDLYYIKDYMGYPILKGYCNFNPCYERSKL
jgi:hypothetical protein